MKERREDDEESKKAETHQDVISAQNLYTGMMAVCIYVGHVINCLRNDLAMWSWSLVDPKARRQIIIRFTSRYYYYMEAPNMPGNWEAQKKMRTTVADLRVEIEQMGEESKLKVDVQARSTYSSWETTTTTLQFSK